MLKVISRNTKHVSAYRDRHEYLHAIHVLDWYASRVTNQDGRFFIFTLKEKTKLWIKSSISGHHA